MDRWNGIEGGVRAATAETRSIFLAALARRDAAAAAAVYAEEARLLLPGADTMSGRDAIQAFWRAGLDAGVVAIDLEPEAVHAQSGFACEIGRYRLGLEPPGDSPVVEQGSYVIVHRPQSDGAWRRELELFTPDALPASPRKGAIP